VIRYRYAQQIQPPAPFVHIRVQNPVTGKELTDVPAQLDTAADRTLIPESLAQALALPQVGTLLIGGVGGVQQPLPTYPLSLGIHDLSPRTIEVVASPGEAWVLLG